MAHLDTNNGEPYKITIFIIIIFRMQSQYRNLTLKSYNKIKRLKRSSSAKTQV